MDIIIGILIPFIGTTLGSMMVFFMKNKLNNSVERLLSGFASGVMIAASIWSLIIPSIESAENLGLISWGPATVGFLIGIFGLIIFDKAIFNLEKNGKKHKLTSKNNVMLFLTVTLHNIPEGMAVRCSISRSNCWKCWNNNCWCNFTCYGNCNSKFPRRCNNFNAF